MPSAPPDVRPARTDPIPTQNPGPGLQDSATVTTTLPPAPTGVLVAVLAVELVTAAAVIVSSTGQPAPTTADLAVAAYLAALGITAAALTVRRTTACGPISSLPGVDLSPVWTLPAALLLHPALTTALVVMLHTHYSRQTSGAGGSPRQHLIGTAAAVLACLAARAIHTATDGNLAVMAAVGCFVVIDKAVLAATTAPDSTGRDGTLLVAATASLGGLTAAALALHPLLVLAVLPAVYCLDLAVYARHLEHANRLDPKTGLLTAATWHNDARRMLRHRGPGAPPPGVLIIDLDHFKTVNDTHGHLAGDAVLAAVADTLRAEVHDADVVGRFGGDEFVVLLSGHDQHGVFAVAEKIRSRITTLQVEAPAPHRTATITGLSVTIGGASVPEHGSDLDTLFRLADTALYEAKRAGRDTVRIGPPIPTTAPSRAD